MPTFCHAAGILASLKFSDMMMVPSMANFRSVSVVRTLPITCPQKEYDQRKMMMHCIAVSSFVMQVVRRYDKSIRH